MLRRRFALFVSVVSIAEIPCDRIAICGKLCIERLCRRDSHGVVQAAARSGGVPALEGMAGLDRRTRRGCRRRIRLACRGDTGLAVNGAAVRSGVPLDRQADGRTAIVALAVAVCVHMVGIFRSQNRRRPSRFWCALCCVIRCPTTNHKNSCDWRNHRLTRRSRSRFCFCDAAYRNIYSTNRWRSCDFHNRLWNIRRCGTLLCGCADCCCNCSSFRSSCYDWRIRNPSRRSCGNRLRAGAATDEYCSQLP